MLLWLLPVSAGCNVFVVDAAAADVLFPGIIVMTGDYFYCLSLLL